MLKSSNCEKASFRLVWFGVRISLGSWAFSSSAASKIRLIGVWQTEFVLHTVSVTNCDSKGVVVTLLQYATDQANVDRKTFDFKVWIPNSISKFQILQFESQLVKFFKFGFKSFSKATLLHKAFGLENLCRFASHSFAQQTGQNSSRIPKWSKISGRFDKIYGFLFAISLWQLSTDAHKYNLLEIYFGKEREFLVIRVSKGIQNGKASRNFRLWSHPVGKTYNHSKTTTSERQIIAVIFCEKYFY